MLVKAINYMGGIFKFPLVRHIIAGIVIFYIGEKKGEIKTLWNEITHLRLIVQQDVKEPKVNVINHVQDVKVKDGAELNFIPETDVQQFNISDPEPPKQKPIPAKNQKKINNLQERLNKLKQKGKRPKRQIELQNRIDRLREPP